MAVNVDFDLKFDFDVTCSSEKVFEVLADVPKSAGHFPKVDQLVDLGDNKFRWEMQKIGTKQLHLQTVYACQYVDDQEELSVKWTPLKGVGNAQIQGEWQIRQQDSGTQITLINKGTIIAPMPALMKKIVKPIVLSQLELQIKEYIENLKKTFNA